ncbi:radical SAM family heme chaperone HemW [Bythopirellula goksoeyrii]|uniref:Heme chaperone HemW n=1 Tax=Bythopirellula goksoeyrii TaxID=1400387 RepID=A0A5B9QA17_9BACT|nr:radical SAM family heme chaperone HemW [Bythopirellula goksoeyrii]QEG34450.1 Oxygen-independent coproporphyrinogen-III oxidase-like protein [Bythopirellula goksoeyrii]
MSFPPPRAAYVHIPFCVHRCGYCNFTVITDRDDLVEPLLTAIETELSWLETPQSVDTLYFGGGTPTYLSPLQLRKLCEVLLQWHPLSQGYEWTVEANPGDLDSERIQVLSEQGVNRLSLGSQSFRREKLTMLERDHSAAEIRSAVELCRQVGIGVSLDLIFGTPGETLSEWLTDLEQAIQLEPDHISTYGLTFERGTQFWNRLQHRELIPVAEELEREMYLAAIDLLAEAGFDHYEISNFARPGYRSRHNETYWSGRGYFAVGPGAARYVDGVRQTNHRSTTTYLRRVQQGLSPVAEEERLDAISRAREALVFGLRRISGIERTSFEALTGFTLAELAGDTIHRFVDLGMLADDGECVKLTREGLLISDSLWPEFL